MSKEEIVLFRGAEGCGMFALVGAESDGEGAFVIGVEIQGRSYHHYPIIQEEQLKKLLKAIDDLPDNYMII